MTGEAPHPAPDTWGILGKMAALVNIIASATTWGLNCEGVKDVAGSRVVCVFSRGRLPGSQEEQPFLRSWLVPGRSHVRVTHLYPELPIALGQAPHLCLSAVPSGSQDAFEAPGTSGTTAQPTRVVSGHSHCPPQLPGRPWFVSVPAGGQLALTAELIKVPGVCQVMLLVINTKARNQSKGGPGT